MLPIHRRTRRLSAVWFLCPDIFFPFLRRRNIRILSWREAYFIWFEDFTNSFYLDRRVYRFWFIRTVFWSSWIQRFSIGFLVWLNDRRLFLHFITVDFLFWLFVLFFLRLLFCLTFWNFQRWLQWVNFGLYWASTISYSIGFSIDIIYLRLFLFVLFNNLRDQLNWIV